MGLLFIWKTLVGVGEQMNENEALKITDLEPDWFQELKKRYQAGTRQFILDFNVRDLVFVPEQLSPDVLKTQRHHPIQLQRVVSFLCHRWAEPFDIVLTYSLTTGIQVYQRDNHHPHFIRSVSVHEAMENQTGIETLLYEEMANWSIHQPYELLPMFQNPTEQSIRYTFDPLQALFFLNRLLTQQHLLPTDINDDASKHRPVRIALLIDYLEHLAPARNIGQRDLIMMTEVLSRWAIDEQIQENDHVIVMVTENIHDVTPELYTGTTSTARIRLLRPERQERRQFLAWLQMQNALSPNENVDRLANLTTGFNYADLRSLTQYANRHTDGQVHDQLIRERKAEIIHSESEERLQIIEPSFGWEQIGGLKHVKESLVDVAQWLQTPELAALVPKGMLFAGPPGTGKTHVAKALAYESGVNMVKLGNVRSEYVGQSERNMTRVLEVARAFAPVIIFVDEIDQAYGQRGTGQGDSGVTSRLFGMLLEFTGDNANRGKVMWIAASNRPDHIDSAMISRFDRVTPFLLPDEVDRAHILLKAMPKVIGFKWANGLDIQQWSSEAQKQFKTILQKTTEFSGRELEQVVRRALELAGQENQGEPQLNPQYLLKALNLFKHSHDKHIYLLQTLLALRVTNFTDFLPTPNALPDIILRVQDGKKVIDWSQVERLLHKLMRGIDIPELARRYQ